MGIIKGYVKSISISLASIVLGMLLPMLTYASVSEDSLDFGEVLVGSSSTRGLRVTNPNTAPIVVTFSILPDACGFSVNPRSLSLAGSATGFVEVTYAPRVEGPCSARLQVTMNRSVEGVLLMGIGVVPKPDVPAPPSNIFIGECDTGIMDRPYEDDQLISERIAECAETAKNHGKFVSCVAHLTNELKRDGIITKEEKQIIQRCAAQAKMP